MLFTMVYNYNDIIKTIHEKRKPRQRKETIEEFLNRNGKIQYIEKGKHIIEMHHLTWGKLTEID